MWHAMQKKAAGLLAELMTVVSRAEMMLLESDTKACMSCYLRVVV